MADASSGSSSQILDSIIGDGEPDEDDDHPITVPDNKTAVDLSCALDFICRTFQKRRCARFMSQISNFWYCKYLPFQKAFFVRGDNVRFSVELWRTTRLLTTKSVVYSRVYAYTLQTCTKNLKVTSEQKKSA